MKGEAMRIQKGLFKSILILMYVCLIIVMNSVVFAHGISSIPQAEKQVLLALYDSTNGPDWENNGGWKTDSDFWYGITCSNGHVESVNLFRNQLTGVIPAEIGNLSNLTSLDLGQNQLTGTIPAEIGNLSNLTSLHLEQNQLTGTIPAEIWNLSNLTSLHLEQNQLTGTIPAEIGNLSNLTYLNLGSNQLTGTFPAEIGNLSNLTYLRLDYNQLTGTIPAEIGNLSNLTSLNLIDNQLTGTIPAEIWNLSNLTSLYLGQNQLTGTIPAEIWNLSNLTSLNLATNQLTGTFPAEIWNLSNLTSLYLEFNQLTGTIPAEIGNLSNLTSLDLIDNQLTGTIPAEIWNLSNLTSLRLGQNQLTGTIPAEIGNLSNLTYLSLGGNQLTGTIPAEIGNLSNLTYLNLGSNQLTGTIPAEIGNLMSLSSLVLMNNKLYGCVPLEVASLAVSLSSYSVSFAFRGNDSSLCIPNTPGYQSIGVDPIGGLPLSSSCACSKITIAQTPMAGLPGTTFVDWGTGFTPGSTAILHFEKPDGTEYPVSEVIINDTGSFELDYVAPYDKPAGTYIWWAIDGVTEISSNRVVYEILAPGEGQMGIKISEIVSPKQNGVPFDFTITAVDAQGLRDFTINKTLKLESTSGERSISPSYVELAGGQWSGKVAIDNAGSNFRITACDGNICGKSNAFSITSLLQLKLARSQARYRICLGTVYLQRLLLA